MRGWAHGCVVVLLACLGATAAWAQDASFDWKPLTAAIEAAMHRGGVVGLSIAIINDQTVIFTRGFGYADLAHKTPATPDTVYAAGGVAQPVTAAAALHLAAQGKLGMDAPLPGMTIKSRFPHADPVTPRNILAHHAGLPAYRFKGLWSRTPTPFTDYPALLADDYLTAAPNSVYSYSEVGYGLLGVALQRASGKPFEHYLADSLFTPLGMAHTGFHPGKAPAATGYRGSTAGTEPPVGNLPAAGLYTSAADMAQFVKLLFAGGKVGTQSLLPAASVHEMLRPQYTDLPLDGDTRVSLGWEMVSVRPMIPYPGPVAECDGDTFLMHARVLLLPQERLGVVVFTNTDTSGGTARDLAIEGLRAALEGKAHHTWYATAAPALPPLPTLSHDALTPYLGAYSLGGALLKIGRQDDRLTVQAAGHTLELAPLGNGRYKVQARVLGLFTFAVGTLRDTALSFATLSGRRVLVAERGGRRSVAALQLPAQPIPARWQKRCGAYTCANPDAGSPVQITEARLAVEDGFLVAVVRAPQGELRVPLLPANDTEATTAGLGRGLGDTVRAVPRDGGEVLVWSGFVFRKK